MTGTATQQPTDVPVPRPLARSATGRRLVGQWGTELALLLLILVLAAGISIGNSSFLTQTNLFNVLQAISVTGIAAIGATLVIISCNLDLSVGSVVGFSGLVGAVAMQGSVAYWGIPAALIVGGLVGLVNGVLITYGGVNAFIATLGMLSVVRGLALVTTDGSPQPIPESMQFIGQGKIAGVPFSAVLLIALVLVTQVFLSRSTTGRRITAVGDNAHAAFLAGIPVRRTIITTFVLAGMFAAVAGLVNASNIALATTDAGTGLELDIVAAVIVGGTSLMGGRGSIIGTLLGSCLLGLLRNAFVLLHLSPYLQVTAIGAVILLAALVDQLRLRRSR